jgi:peptidoglycan/LPS O-acetylase OafA/YrhL
MTTVESVQNAESSAILQPRESEESPAVQPFVGGRLYILDGLRLVAALMVVIWHFVGANSSQAYGKPTSSLFPAVVWKLAHYGWTGVYLFFLISGFVICMSAWGRPMGDFAASRITRLFPAYWFAVLLTSAVLTVAPIFQGRRKLSDTVSNLSMFQELLGVRPIDPAYWTLLVEMQFYLLFAIVVAKGLTYKRVVTFCAVWTLVSLAASAYSVPGSAALAPRFSSFFVAGIAFYLIYRFGSSLLLWGIVGFSWIICMNRIIKLAAGNYGADWRPASVAITLFFVLVALIALHKFDWIRWKALVAAGALTYPLYLVHQEIGLTLIKGFSEHIAPVPLLLSVIAVVLLLAYLIHHLVEKPVARLLKRGLSSSLAQLRRG